MGKYTQTIKEIIEQDIDIFENINTFYNDIAEDFEQFKIKFTNHYKYNEIGFEDIEQFKDRLNSKLEIIMPYYRELYRTQLETNNIDFMLNKNLIDTLIYEINKETDNIEKNTGTVNFNDIIKDINNVTSTLSDESLRNQLSTKLKELDSIDQEIGSKISSKNKENIDLLSKNTLDNEVNTSLNVLDKTNNIDDDQTKTQTGEKINISSNVQSDDSTINIKDDKDLTITNTGTISDEGANNKDLSESKSDIDNGISKVNASNQNYLTSQSIGKDYSKINNTKILDTKDKNIEDNTSTTKTDNTSIITTGDSEIYDNIQDKYISKDIHKEYLTDENKSIKTNSSIDTVGSNKNEKQKDIDTIGKDILKTLKDKTSEDLQQTDTKTQTTSGLSDKDITKDSIKTDDLTKKVDNLETINETRENISKGIIGILPSEALKKWRSIIINIDKQIIDELRDLFMLIY